jgi:hypothetical protein
MEQKDIVAIVLLFIAASGGVLLCTISRRMRDLFFFALITLSAVTENVDVNFVSRDWYRGTTRGYEVSLVDTIAISVLVGSLLRPRRGARRWFWPPGLGLMIIYFGYACLCVAEADPKLYGYFQLLKMVRGMIIFTAVATFVRGERELRLMLFALGLIVCWEGLLALVQRYHDGIHRVFGTVDDSNSLSMYFCMTAPVFVAVINSRLPKFLKLLGATAVALAFVGVVLSISRAGLVTVSLVLLAATLATMSYQLTARKVLISVFVMLAAGGVIAKAWHTLGSRFEETDFKREYKDKKVQGRGYYIRIAEAMVADHWFGVGPNNWSYWASDKYGPEAGFKFVPYNGTDYDPGWNVGPDANVDNAQAAPAHSLAALTAGEMGLGGLFLFTLLWLRWFQMGASFLGKRTDDPMQRIGVGIFFGTCGIFFQSLTEWVYHQTPIFFTFNILLGTLAALYFGKKYSLTAPEPLADSADETPQSANVEEIVW